MYPQCAYYLGVLSCSRSLYIVKSLLKTTSMRRSAPSRADFLLCSPCFHASQKKIHAKRASGHLRVTTGHPQPLYGDIYVICVHLLVSDTTALYLFLDL